MLLSVIVPVSRMAGRLQNLKSWVNFEGIRNLKIVIVHDFQDEETESELRSLVDDLDSKNVSMVSGKFGGPGAARNAGMELISTPWFAFWDSDDCPKVKEFLDMISRAENEKKDIAIGEFQIRDYATNRIECYSSTESKNLKLAIALNPGLWRMAFRSSKYGATRFPNFRMGEDQCWLSTIDLNESNIFILNRIVYEYIKGDPNQLTSINNSYLELAQTGNYLMNSLKIASVNSRDFLSFLLLKQQISILKRGNLKHRMAALKRIFQVLNSNQKPKIFYFFLKALTSRKYLKKPIRVILNGGIGNQLFQLSAGAFFGNNFPIEVLSITQGTKSEIENNSSKMVLRQNFGFFLTNLRVSYFQQKSLNLGLRLSARVDNSLTRLNLLHKSLLRITELSWSIMHPSSRLKIARGLGYFPSLGNFTGKEILLGYFQSEKFALSLNSPSELLELSDEFNNNTLVRAKLTAAESNPLIVQIRLGDYSQNPHFGKLSKEYFEEVIKEALTESTCKALWLFSDNMAEARDLIPSHLTVPVIEKTLDGASSAEVLKVMSLGKVFVISNSTFGWWAAYLAGFEHNDVRTYYPEPWFKEIPQPEGLFPSNWRSKPALFE